MNRRINIPWYIHARKNAKAIVYVGLGTIGDLVPFFEAILEHKRQVPDAKISIIISNDEAIKNMCAEYGVEYDQLSVVVRKQMQEGMATSSGNKLIFLLSAIGHAIKTNLSITKQVIQILEKRNPALVIGDDKFMYGAGLAVEALGIPHLGLNVATFFDQYMMDTAPQFLYREVSGKSKPIVLWLLHKVLGGLIFLLLGMIQWWAIFRSRPVRALSLGLRGGFFLGKYMGKEIIRIYPFTPKVWPYKLHAKVYIPGPILYDRRRPLSTETEEFIGNEHARGQKVIAVGFGSMVDNPAELTELFIKAIETRKDVSLVCVTAWGGMKAVQHPRIHFTANEFFGELLPRVDAYIGHTGSGTAHYCWVTGTPIGTIMFVPDQKYWAAESVKAGVGTAAIPRKEVTVENIGETMDYLLSSTVQIEADRFCLQFYETNGEPIYSGLDETVSLIRETYHALSS